MGEKAKTERLYAFTVRGRYTQTHYVRATSVKAARARWDAGFTDESDEFMPYRTSAKRCPELDSDESMQPNPERLT